VFRSSLKETTLTSGGGLRLIVLVKSSAEISCKKGRKGYIPKTFLDLSFPESIVINDFYAITGA
jgi:hypothetical protein